MQKKSAEATTAEAENTSSTSLENLFSNNYKYQQKCETIPADIVSKNFLKSNDVYRLNTRGCFNKCPTKNFCFVNVLYDQI